MHMEYVLMKTPKRRRLAGVGRDMEDWLKYHTLQDLRDIAFEMYNRGEDISEVVQLVHEYDEIAHRMNIGNEEAVYTDAEYDILTYVQQVETAYV
jgi:hypothetical protein